MSVNAGVTIVSDIGTGSVKAALFTADGDMVASRVVEYPPGSESDGEIDPEVWWNAFGESVRGLGREADLSQVSAVIGTGQMQNLIRVPHLEASGSSGEADGPGEAFRSRVPAILYYDSRGHERLEALCRLVSRERIVSITGNTPDGSSFSTKLLSLSEPVASDERILCAAHDYIAWKLTGVYRTDRTTAGTTGLLDLDRCEWSLELLEAAGVTAEMMPAICSAAAEDGTIASPRARELGLPGGVRVIHGAGDVGASVLASVLSAGRVGCYLGTSGWVLDVGPPGERGDPENGVFNLPHPTDSALIRVAPLLTAAGAVDWFEEIVRADVDGWPDDPRSEASGPNVQRTREPDGANAERVKEAYDPKEKPANEASVNEAGAMVSLQRLAGAAAAQAGPTGVLFLPHLSGERSPFKDPAASGAFLGLRRTDDRTTLFKAVLEGVCFALRSVLETVVLSNDSDLEILLSGGGGAIAGMPQLLADITGATVRSADDSRFAGGRGMLRVVGTNITMFEEERSVVPHEKRKSRYNHCYQVYRRFYPQTRDLMYELSRIRGEASGK